MIYGRRKELILLLWRQPGSADRPRRVEETELPMKQQEPGITVRWVTAHPTAIKMSLLAQWAKRA